MMLLAFTACGPSSYVLEQERDLECGEIPTPGGRNLCQRIQGALVLGRGHARIFGPKHYGCGHASVVAVYCDGQGVTIEDINSIYDLKKDGRLLVTSLEGCLLGLRHAIETAALPKSQRSPSREVVCPR